MRNIIAPGLFALAFLGFCAGSASAGEVVVKVPFAFQVGKSTMPAGEYTVDRLDRDPYVMVIRGTNLHNRSMAIVGVDPAPGHDPAGDKPSLTFIHRENQYKLSSIWESREHGEEVWGS